MISDDTIDIGIGMGTGITIHKYYNANENIFSGEFTNVLTNSDKLIAYIDVSKENPLENRKVVVQNIFDKSLFYEEFKLDFSNVDTPVIEAKFSKDGASLLLTYLSGVIYALSDFLIMILSWLVKQSLRAFLFQEVQP